MPHSYFTFFFFFFFALIVCVDDGLLLLRAGVPQLLDVLRASENLKRCLQAAAVAVDGTIEILKPQLLSAKIDGSSKYRTAFSLMISSIQVLLEVNFSRLCTSTTNNYLLLLAI